MATAFKNARQAVGATYTTVYTCPSATTAIIIGCQLANVDGVNAAIGYVQWLDSSASNAATRLLEGGTVPAKYSVEVIPNKLVLEAGDVIQAKASATGDLELSVSVLEIS